MTAACRAENRAIKSVTRFPVDKEIHRRHRRNKDINVDRKRWNKTPEQQQQQQQQQQQFFNNSSQQKPARPRVIKQKRNRSCTSLSLSLLSARVVTPAPKHRVLVVEAAKRQHHVTKTAAAVVVAGRQQQQ